MSTKQVSLNIDQAKDFIRHIISNNRSLQERGMVPVAVELEGGSGIGKTSLALQLAAEMSSLDDKPFDMVKLSLSQIEELGDLVGFPVREFQMKKGEEIKWVDEHAVEQYGKLGFTFTDQKRMSYCPPEWIADKKAGGILLLDDYSRADVRFLQAVMELIDRQTYISWKLPADWHILLTSNPDNGDYLVNVLDTAQKTRFVSVDLKFDVDCWARWAESQGIDGRCINFLLLHPEMVTEKCNARSITTFFNSISSYKDFEKELGMIEQIGEGSVGAEFSTAFVLFINNRLDRLVSPKVMVTEKEWVKVRDQMVECIGQGGSYRGDIASVLTTRVINYCQLNYKDSKPSKEVIERLIKLSTEEVLTDDLKYHMVTKLINGDGKAAFREGLFVNKEVVKMSMK